MEMDDGFVLSENFFDTALAGKERNGSGIRQTRTRMSEWVKVVKREIWYI